MRHFEPGNAINSDQTLIFQQPQGAHDEAEDEQPLRVHQPPVRLSTCHAWQRREQRRGQQRSSAAPILLINATYDIEVLLEV